MTSKFKKDMSTWKLSGETFNKLMKLSAHVNQALGLTKRHKLSPTSSHSVSWRWFPRKGTDQNRHMNQ